MKRSLLILALLLMGCGQWRTHDVPLQFTKKWIAGVAEVSAPDANGVNVTIRVRLADAEAFANEFNIEPPHGFPCQNIRLIYRHTHRSAPRALRTGRTDSSRLWTSEPEVCLHGGLESAWRVLVARGRRDLEQDINDPVVLISDAGSEASEEIAIEVLRKRTAPADFIQPENGDPIDRFVIARSQWLPLRKR